MLALNVYALRNGCCAVIKVTCKCIYIFYEKISNGNLLDVERTQNMTCLIVDLIDHLLCIPPKSREILELQFHFSKLAVNIVAVERLL